MSALLTIFAGLAALVWGGFLVWYTIRAKWWKSTIGRNVAGVSSVLFLVFLRIFMSRVVPGFQEIEVIGILVYGLAIVYGVQRLVQMELAQRVIDIDLKNKEK